MIIIFIFIYSIFIQDQLYIERKLININEYSISEEIDEIPGPFIKIDDRYYFFSSNYKKSVLFSVDKNFKDKRIIKDFSGDGPNEISIVKNYYIIGDTLIVTDLGNSSVKVFVKNKYYIDYKFNFRFFDGYLKNKNEINLIYSDDLFNEKPMSIYNINLINFKELNETPPKNLYTIKNVNPILYNSNTVFYKSEIYTFIMHFGIVMKIAKDNYNVQVLETIDSGSKNIEMEVLGNIKKRKKGTGKIIIQNISVSDRYIFILSYSERKKDKNFTPIDVYNKNNFKYLFSLDLKFLKENLVNDILYATDTSVVVYANEKLIEFKFEI